MRCLTVSGQSVTRKSVCTQSVSLPVCLPSGDSSSSEWAHPGLHSASGQLLQEGWLRNQNPQGSQQRGVGEAGVVGKALPLQLKGMGLQRLLAEAAILVLGGQLGWQGR